MCVLLGGVWPADGAVGGVTYRRARVLLGEGREVAAQAPPEDHEGQIEEEGAEFAIHLDVLLKLNWITYTSEPKARILNPLGLSLRLLS